MSQGDTLLLDANLEELFEPILLDVLDSHKVKISNHSYLYLLNLLSSYGLKNKSEESGPGEEPMLSERLFRAMAETEKREKARSLKSLAENSLIKVGFFSLSLKRKLIGVRYHIDIGAMAYSHLYSETKEPAYEEASERFPDYADILAGVRERLNLSNDTKKDLIGLYEWFSETGSKKAQSELLDQGVDISSPKKASNQ